MEKILAGAVQFNHRPGDPTANLEIVRRMTAEAAAGGVKLLVFPEMCVTGYWHVRNLDRAGVAALAEPVPDGPTTQALLALAADYGMTVGAGTIEAAGGTFYNTYVVAMPDGSYARHRKLHCFINEHLQSGDEFTVFDAPGIGRLGVLICYDNNIVENVRATALLGAEILLAPHQTGGCDTPSPRCMGAIDPALWARRAEDPAAIEAEFRGPKGRAWLMHWLPARAHDSGIFVIFANGVGIDDNEVRTGNAMIIDPYGDILAETWRAADETVVAELDPKVRVQCTGSRWLRTRRPGLYSILTEARGSEEDVRKVRFEAKPAEGSQA